MSEVRKFHPEVRLKALLTEPGGLTAKVALDRAADNLEVVREDCLAAIDAKIDAMTKAASGRDEGRAGKIYRLANEVFAEAGAFGLAELSTAAHSLCSLVASAPAGRAVDAATLVHIDAMRALRRPSSDKAGHAAVLAGLRSLSTKLCVAD